MRKLQSRHCNDERPRLKDGIIDFILRKGSKGRASALPFALLAVMLTMTSCKYTATPADLLQKPAVSAEQEQLTAAIEKALPRFSMLMLPHRDDDYKEAIRLLDVNGDGVDEAVVTYYNEYSTPEIMVLRQTEYGWRQFISVEQYLARDIAWLRITDLDGDGGMELLVGWIGSFDSPNVLELYSFQSEPVRNERGVPMLQPLQSLPYSLAESNDLDGDGKAELIVIDSLGTSGEMVTPSYYLSVYEWNKDHIEKRAIMSLPHETTMYDRLLVGRISERHRGILLETGVGAHSMLTYMYAWENGALRLIYPATENGQPGFTGTPMMSGDINGDGIIELQWVNEAPGNEAAAYEDTIWMDKWMQWDGKQGYRLIAERYSNYTYGLEIDIPKEWRGRYTMRQPKAASYGIVTFEYWNKKRSATAELAQLYVVPLNQWGSIEAAWKEENRHFRQIATYSGNAVLISFTSEAPEHLTEDEKKEFLEMKKAEPEFSSYLTILHDDWDEGR